MTLVPKNRLRVLIELLSAWARWMCGREERRTRSLEAEDGSSKQVRLSMLSCTLRDAHAFVDL